MNDQLLSIGGEQASAFSIRCIQVRCTDTCSVDQMRLSSLSPQVPLKDGDRIALQREGEQGDTRTTLLEWLSSEGRVGHVMSRQFFSPMGMSVHQLLQDVKRLTADLRCLSFNVHQCLYCF